MPEISGDSFLIVTEGEKTELIYFQALRDRLKLSNVQVEIVHPPATDPLSLVQHAIEMEQERKRATRKGQGVPFDQIWVVFDLEKEHDERRKIAAKAQELAQGKRIYFAESLPCFEFWLLLHWKQSVKPYEDCKAVSVELISHCSDYTKGMQNASEFIILIETAVKNARDCRRHNEDCGSENPSTDVDKLVTKLNENARPHFRFTISK